MPSENTLVHPNVLAIIGNTPPSVLSKVFSEGTVALEENQMAGIATIIDLIDYLAGRSG